MVFSMEQNNEEFHKDEYINLPGLEKREEWTYDCWYLADAIKESERLIIL